MIKFVNVTKLYKPELYALRDISFHIKPFEFVSIVGHSGAGKSTIIRLLVGEERLSDGKIFIGDWNITNIKSSEVPVLRRQIGVVFQDFKLLEKKTVYENVAFPLDVVNMPLKKMVPIV